MNIFGLGSMWSDDVTKLTVGPFNWTTAQVKPTAGDLLIAFVECSTEWDCPVGWTRNGEVATRRMTVQDGEFVFRLLERGSMRLHLALGSTASESLLSWPKIQIEGGGVQYGITPMDGGNHG